MKKTTDILDSENLINCIVRILTTLGHPRPTDWMRYLHPDALNTNDGRVQRFLINRCFRIILGNCSSENTMDTRYCLVDMGELNDWARLFKDGVAPTIVRLSLPPAIN